MRLKKFLKQEKGNVVFVMALALPTTILAIGGAVDYAHVLKKKAELQAAVDSATLAAAVHAASNPDDSRGVRQRFETFLREDLSRTNLLQLSDFDLQYISRETKVRATVRAKVPTTFLKLAGINPMNLTVQAEASAGTGRTEVALVLDTTLSMVQNPDGSPNGKLNELKQAATNFLNTVHQNLRGPSDSFKVAIVPFAEYVNVGTQYRNASWINVPQDRTITETASYCERWVCTAWSNGESGRECTDGYHEPIPCVTEETSLEIRWEGCVGSRNEPLNLKDESYTGGNRVPGVMNFKRNTWHPESSLDGWRDWDRNHCGAALTPLTSLRDNKAMLISKINALTANGFTYIPAGLVWGWRVLSHKEPFSQGASNEDVRERNVRKIIVLMTDGRNTLGPTTSGGRSFADHSREGVDGADDYLRRLCDNIKQINPETGRPYAEIITVTFDVRDAATRNMLRDCASIGSYDARSGELTAVFRSIARQLAQVHLSR